MVDLAAHARLRPGRISLLIDLMEEANPSWSPDVAYQLIANQDCTPEQVIFSPASTGGGEYHAEEMVQSPFEDVVGRVQVGVHARVALPAPGRVCMPAGLYASVCIRGCIHFFFPFRLGSNVPGMVRGRVCIVCIIPL